MNRNVDCFTQDSLPGPPLGRSNTNLKPRVAASPVRKRRSGGKIFNFFGRGVSGSGNNPISSLNNNAFNEFSKSEDQNFNQGLYVDSNPIPTASVFQFSQDSCSNSNSQFSQDFTDRFGSFNVRSQYNGDNGILNLSTSEDSNISIDGFNIPSVSSRPTSMRMFTAPSGGSSKNNISSSFAQETERQIDIPPALKNIFVERAAYDDDTEEFASRFSGNNSLARKATKMWISAFRERSRYLSDFEEICLLGEGTFSSVFCVRHRLDGTLYAVKRLKDKIIHENQGRLLMREVNALSVLRGCPNIIQYYGCWLDDHHLHIQTELCHLGSLEDLISATPSQCSVMSLCSDKSDEMMVEGSLSFKAIRGSSSSRSQTVRKNNEYTGRGITEDLAWLLLYDICSALEYMHQKGIVHMDLRPANCFLTMGQGHHGGYQSLTKFADDKNELRDNLEKLIVSREFILKLGDMGHACPQDEKRVDEGEYKVLNKLNSSFNILYFMFFSIYFLLSVYLQEKIDIVQES